MGLGAPKSGAEGLGSQVAPTTLRMAEKRVYGDFRFVKWFGDLSHQTQQVWVGQGDLSCGLGGNAPTPPPTTPLVLTDNPAAHCYRYTGGEYLPTM